MFLYLKCFISIGLLLSFFEAAANPSEKRQQELKHLLVQDCGSCHGLTLKGGLGTPLTPETLKNKPDEFLVHTILNGRAGTAMPPWKPFISESEAQWLVNELKKGLKK